jgi:hypothetical protein
MKTIVVTLFLLSTGAMTGLIWFVQIVHYPLFQSVGREVFTAYEQAHKALTTMVVAPLMLTELVTSVILLTISNPFNRTFLLANLVLLGIIWLSTAFIQVPLHGRLSTEFNTSNVDMLVKSNWIRTIAWTIRSTWAFYLIAQTVKS